MLEPAEQARYRRQLKSMVTAAGQDDPEHLADVVALLAWAQAEIRTAVEALRTPTEAAPGYSWADIARPLGITRQTAWERFGQQRAISSRCAECHSALDERFQCPVCVPLPLEIEATA